MLDYMQQLHKENMSLKVQLSEERDGKYNTPGEGTPEDEKAQRLRATEAVRSGAARQLSPEMAAEPREREGRTVTRTRTSSAQERSESTGPTFGAGSDERRHQGQPEDAERQRRHSSPEVSTKQTMDMMLRIMEGMQTMQQQLMGHVGSQKKSADGVEEITRANIELHKLAEWTVDSAPVDFQDWLMLIGPQMSDLSAASGDWWTEIVETARSWYLHHQTLKPIERLKHTIEPTPELQKKRWSRLEKRASSLLIQALPESQKT